MIMENLQCCVAVLELQELLYGLQGFPLSLTVFTLFCACHLMQFHASLFAIRCQCHGGGELAVLYCNFCFAGIALWTARFSIANGNFMLCCLLLDVMVVGNLQCCIAILALQELLYGLQGFPLPLTVLGFAI